MTRSAQVLTQSYTCAHCFKAPYYQPILSPLLSSSKQAHYYHASIARELGMTDSSPSQTPLTYRDAGVDIDAGNALVERIKAVSKATFRSEVLTGLGGFGALDMTP